VRRGRPRLGSRVALASAAARQAVASRVEVLARAGFYVVLLLVFSRLWPAVPGISRAESSSLLWYLAVTEWVLLSVPSLQFDLERDVRRGDVAVLLAAPVPWLDRRLCEALGALAVRLAVLGAVGFAAAWALAGRLPEDPRGLPWALLLGAAAAAFGVVAQAAIGVAAVWLHDVAPLYWIWQKSAFLLGGLVIPLAFYPSWLAAFASWTPFAAFLNGPGRLATGLDAGAALRDAALLAGWTLVAALVLRTLHRRALRVLDVHGG
jgi:ABC-2 type transport system permease protein